MPTAREIGQMMADYLDEHGDGTREAVIRLLDELRRAMVASREGVPETGEPANIQRATSALQIAAGKLTRWSSWWGELDE